MRIVHVVTYVSPDGAFGGPARVALGQAAALAERGHEVTVFAAGPEQRPVRRVQDGYELRIFPAHRLGRGFAGMWSPALTRALRTALPRFDAGHVHLARDLVTLPAARAMREFGLPYVAQPHGMIGPSDRVLARPLDRIATGPALEAAHVVLALTAAEIEALSEIAPHARFDRVVNAVKANALPAAIESRRTVLFLARLHARKRPAAFIEMAELLALDDPALDFVIAGPDAGEGAEIARQVKSSTARIRLLGPIAPSKTEALFSSARVYVLPAVAEVFPMTVLEAFQAGTPVVTTASLGIADDCRRYGAALMTDGSPRELARAVRHVLTDPQAAEGLREGGYRYLRAELDVDRLAGALERRYASATGIAGDPSPRTAR